MKQGTGRPASAARKSARIVAKASVRRWTKAREAIFIRELEMTANVAHSARAAGMSDTAAHHHKRRNPGFAAEWKRALATGYAELELHLLRQSIHGSERTESVRDADGTVTQTKTVHSYPHLLAMRLLSLHREEVERYRVMEGLRDGADPAVAERVRAEMAKVRARLHAAMGDTSDEEGDGSDG